jgi:hypothetical protein
MALKIRSSSVDGIVKLATIAGRLSAHHIHLAMSGTNHFGDKPGERARKKVREIPPTPRLPTCGARLPPQRTRRACTLYRRLPAGLPVPARSISPHPVPCFGLSNLARISDPCPCGTVPGGAVAVHAGKAWQHTLLIPRVQAKRVLVCMAWQHALLDRPLEL